MKKQAKKNAPSSKEVGQPVTKNQLATIKDTPGDERHAATHLGVARIAIQMAKHRLGTNNREEIYAWIEANRGSSQGVII